MRSRTLIIEDDSPTRELLAELLHSMDCDVHTVTNGEDALSRIRTQQYDVILLDIALPNMSGVELMESLREEMPRALASIIVVTGLNIAEIRTLFPAVHDTLTKPVMPSRLREAVRSCLVRGQTGRVATIDERITSR